MENSKRCLKFSDVFKCLNVVYGIEDDITCVNEAEEGNLQQEKEIKQINDNAPKSISR